jgi:hypothetical protein
MKIKVNDRINRRRIIIYLGTIIFLSGDARALLEGWASSPAEVLVLAAWDARQKASKRHQKICSIATRFRELRAPRYGGSSIITRSAGALSCLHLVPSTTHFFFCPPPDGTVAVVWSAVEGRGSPAKLDQIRLGASVSTEGAPSPLASSSVGFFYPLLSSSDSSASTSWSG